MKYMVDAQTPADDEILTGILQVLAKQHGIRFAAMEAAADAPAAFSSLPVAATTAEEWAQRLQESEASGTVSWEDAKARFGL
ncbi:hypothetical protein Q5H93_22935 [Hymenobacter sp. ASUV-10]|uniref:Uncharacterized protein n=1 Tax=Hymenobacter aranciens TaxID=3063996 RepID=A0ABT9BIW1_9BACT|nr:hypothetical protein [Hymenobacter sp. ASUV-10]MDO7877613.1 hypothetical protein [Hymenobacter sp. ASUV-10]